MEQPRGRAWLSAVTVSSTAFALVCWLGVAALDQPLSEAWQFPALFLGVLLAVKGYFIERRNK